jgi:hypothetical protein
MPGSWFTLPHSGQAWWSPDGSPPHPAAVQSSEPHIDAEHADVLEGTATEIETAIAAYPIEEVRRLIEAEGAGRNRTTVVAALDRRAKAIEGS